MMRRFVAHQGEHQCSTEAGVEPAWPSPRSASASPRSSPPHRRAPPTRSPSRSAPRRTSTASTRSSARSSSTTRSGTSQYATLTDKAAKDFSVTPGLAESWKISDDGLTVTYTLREGLKWSDGQPLTAEDVAYTINRSRDEEWINHVSTTANLDAKALDDRTVEVTSSVPDPKLPVMDVYIVPKHIYEKYDKEAVYEYDGQDGVGSGPFTVTEVKKGEFVRMAQNPNWHGKKPAMDEVIFRIYANSEAQYQALKTGELDAVDDVPIEIFTTLDPKGDIAPIAGNQGDFFELAMNSGCGTWATVILRSRTSRCARPSTTPSTGISYREDRQWPRPAGSGLAGVGRCLVVQRPRSPRSGPVRVRPGEGQGAPRRGGLEGHQRRRHPRQGRSGARSSGCSI